MEVVVVEGVVVVVPGAVGVAVSVAVDVGVTIVIVISFDGVGDTAAYAVGMPRAFISGLT